MVTFSVRHALITPRLLQGILMLRMDAVRNVRHTAYCQSQVSLSPTCMSPL